MKYKEWKYWDGYTCFENPSAWNRLLRKAPISWVRYLVMSAKYATLFYLCKRFGHKIEDCSSAGPDSGNADHYCTRCGEYWAVRLY